MPLNYRSATTADLDGIVEVFLACWRESYAAVLPRQLVEAMTDDGAVELWTRVLGEASDVPGADVLVAEPQEPSGKVILGVARTNARARGEGMIHSLYVAPHAQGRGIGSRLLTAACEALISAGSVTGYLWVFRQNAPSVAFYRHKGWLPDGRTRVQDEFGEPEIRLAKILRLEQDAGVTP
jgi:GNAT superfamily N-acetyltransferase